jgi:uncharacterized membrane protein
MHSDDTDHVSIGSGQDHPFFSGLRTYFFAGVIVTAPIGITIYLTWIFLSFIDTRVTALIPARYNPFNYVPNVVPGIELLKALISLILVIIFFILVGWFVRNFLGRVLYNISEYILHRMPVINNIYKAVKQVIETVMTTQSAAFRDVVMIEYPRKGVWSLGFVTGESKGEVQRVTANKMINVFLPTTPNPTSGYLLFVPAKEVKYMDMTVEEAAKLIVSAGIIVPPDRMTSLKEKTLSAPETKKSSKSASAKASKTTKTTEKSASASQKKTSAKKSPATKSSSAKKPATKTSAKKTGKTGSAGKAGTKKKTTSSKSKKS